MSSRIRFRASPALTPPLLLLLLLVLAAPSPGCARRSRSIADLAQNGAGKPRVAMPSALVSVAPSAPIATALAPETDRAAATQAPPRAQRDLDGNDDPEPASGESTVVPSMTELAFSRVTERSWALTRVGRAPLALQRICDLTVLGDVLFATHARQPLGSDGATVTRYQPALAEAAVAAMAQAVSPTATNATTATTAPTSTASAGGNPFRVVFDWNRIGEPSKGGGAGQGFLRAHRIDGRLWVPDADPPYNGFGLAEYGTEGYVFVSGTDGSFARARMPKHLPPSAPTVSSPHAAVPTETGDAGSGVLATPGAAVLPRAYHVIDVIKFRGHMYASTGSVPPKERAWNGPSPGALHIADANLARWNYALGYPVPYQNGVWRLTYMVRFRDRLYAGIQDYDGVEPNSYVQFAPPSGRDVLTQEDAKPVRIAGYEGTNTLRWFTDGSGDEARLYWLVYARRTGEVALLVTADGDSWQRVALPEAYGRPTDIVRYQGALVVLTERALLRLSEAHRGERVNAARAGDDAGAPQITLLAEVPVDSKSKKSPFQVDDLFCVAPLAVYRGSLYAGGQRDGALFRFGE
jgi:hypothetical protein